MIKLSGFLEIPFCINSCYFQIVFSKINLWYSMQFQMMFHAKLSFLFNNVLQEQLQYNNNKNCQTTMLSAPTNESMNVATLLSKIATIRSSIPLLEAMDSYKVHELIDHHVKLVPSPWHRSINFLFTYRSHGTWWISFTITNQNWLILSHTCTEGDVMWRDSIFEKIGIHLHQIQKIGMLIPVKDGNIQIFLARYSYLARNQPFAMKATLVKLVK